MVSAFTTQGPGDAPNNVRYGIRSTPGEDGPNSKLQIIFLMKK
jgi:hypothetical protein